LATCCVATVAASGRAADFGCAPAVVPDGFGEVAASTAVTSVLAAARAPTPSARPKRTESMCKSVAALAPSAKDTPSNAAAVACILRSQDASYLQFQWRANEEFSLDGDGILCSGSGFVGLGTPSHASHSGSRPQPGSRLVRSPHRSLKVLSQSESALVQFRCGSVTLGVFCSEFVPRNAVPRRLLSAGNTRCAVSSNFQAAGGGIESKGQKLNPEAR